MTGVRLLVLAVVDHQAAGPRTVHLHGKLGDDVLVQKAGRHIGIGAVLVIRVLRDVDRTVLHREKPFADPPFRGHFGPRKVVLKQRLARLRQQRRAVGGENGSAGAGHQETNHREANTVFHERTLVGEMDRLKESIVSSAILLPGGDVKTSSRKP